MNFNAIQLNTHELFSKRISMWKRMPAFLAAQIWGRLINYFLRQFIPSSSH